MAGLPGSGKSTLALALGRALGSAVIDKDTLHSTLLTAGLPNALAAPTAYELMLALARDLLIEQWRSVILDSPALHPSTVQRATELARLAGVPLVVVLCLAPKEIRDRRVTARARKASQPPTPSSQTEDIGHQRGAFRHLPAGTLRVDTTQPLAETVAEVLAYLTPPSR